MIHGSTTAGASGPGSLHASSMICVPPGVVSASREATHLATAVLRAPLRTVSRRTGIRYGRPPCRAFPGGRFSTWCGGRRWGVSSRAQRMAETRAGRASPAD